jgi:hypothetical protein
MIFKNLHLLIAIQTFIALTLYTGTQGAEVTGLAFSLEKCKKIVLSWS